MATPTSRWLTPASGNFADASLWSSGVPDSRIGAVIEDEGTTPYTVTVDSRDRAASLTLAAKSGTLKETSAGSLDVVGDFQIARDESSSFYFAGKNTFGSLTMLSGTLAESAHGSLNVTGASSVTGGVVRLAGSNTFDSLTAQNNGAQLSKIDIVSTGSLSVTHGFTVSASDLPEVNSNSILNLAGSVTCATLAIGPHTTVHETASGSLNVAGKFSIQSGNPIVLNGTNTFGHCSIEADSVTLNGTCNSGGFIADGIQEGLRGSLNVKGEAEIAGTLEGTNTFGSLTALQLYVSSSGALGNEAVTVRGSITATADMTTTDPVFIHGNGGFGADNGATFTLTGPLTFSGLFNGLFEGDSTGGSVRLENTVPDSEFHGDIAEIAGEQVVVASADAIALFGRFYHIRLIAAPGGGKTGILTIDNDFGIQKIGTQIDGTGSVHYTGSGITETGYSESDLKSGYSGETVIRGTTVVPTTADAFGTGAVSISQSSLDLRGGIALANDLETAKACTFNFIDFSGDSILTATLTSSVMLAADTAFAFAHAAALTPSGITDSAPVTVPTIVLNLAGFNDGGHTHALHIDDVTVKATITNEAAFDSLVSTATAVHVGSGGILDLVRQDDITLNALSGRGEVFNGAAHQTLTVANSEGAFTGVIRGNFDITTANDDFSHATLALLAGDTLHMSGDASFLALDGTVFKQTVPNVDMGTGTSNTLVLNHDFAGAISDFAAGDTITIADETFAAGTVSIAYNENTAGDGGDLLVTIGTQPTIDLHLTGSYTADDFSVDASDTGAISIHTTATHAALAHIVDALI